MFSILLGNISLTSSTFSKAEQLFSSLKEKKFLALSLPKRFKYINAALSELIQNEPENSFLLGAILDFLDKVNETQVLKEPITISQFEFWCNHFSHLTEEQNYAIRAKISGRKVPRRAYQNIFPIGMDQVYQGTHFVAAHLSPDIDTMIASFWGWLDAFSVRIGTGLHIWSLPGGPPNLPVTLIFQSMFGAGLFTLASRTNPHLTLTAMDLVTQKGFFKEKGHRLISEIDHSDDKAVILIDEEGHYLGEWRNSDSDLVRQIIILFKSCLRWFENNFHTQLISLFSKSQVKVQDFDAFYRVVFDVKIQDCEPALEFNENQKKYLHNFFEKILKVKNGLQGTFREFNEALTQFSIFVMHDFQKAVEQLPKSNLFDELGQLKEDRPNIFHHLDKIIQHLDIAVHAARNYPERLEVVLAIKHQVLNIPSVYITLRSDVEEIKQKMQDLDFLTVVIQEQENVFFPVGIVRAIDIRKESLGSITSRDFSNQDEMRKPSYLEVISIIDHHKTDLETLSVPCVTIGDVQSCNVLLAEHTFLLNDRYSLGGMKENSIETQIQEMLAQPSTPSQSRILQRLLQRRIAAKTRHNYQVHPQRELMEYFSYLYAILDDTDLLTKVSIRDIFCVTQLLNRLKSLVMQKEVEIIVLDDLLHEKDFLQKAAQRILEQEDMYSIYKKIYLLREAEIKLNLELCAEGRDSNIFADIKEQNGCASVSQTKLFSSNFSSFLKHAAAIKNSWLGKSQKIYQTKNEIDLHIHMISTVASADEVHKHSKETFLIHKDELWFWTPRNQSGYDHLNRFLAAFQYGIKELKNSFSIEFLGLDISEYKRIFQHHFPKITSTHTIHDQSFVILRFEAGKLNSRKSYISRFLPT